MVVGFNHNFRYKGEVYHIQTEDSGMRSPNIVTLLYQGGTILASKKTSYADIAKVDNLDQVVEELMKEQHKEMLRKLKAGEFDAVIERFQSGRRVTPEVSEGKQIRVSEVGKAPVATESPASVVAPAAQVVAPQTPVVEPKPEAVVKTPPVAAAAKPPSPTVEISLDEVILSYLMGDD